LAYTDTQQTYKLPVEHDLLVNTPSLFKNNVAITLHSYICEYVDLSFEEAGTSQFVVVDIGNFVL